MFKVYPAVFHKDDGSFWVEFPDLPGCQTYGDTLEHTMELAEEALGLYLSDKLENGVNLPEATDYENIDTPSDAFVSYVSADPNKYHRNTKAVKKTLSIPAWLADEADARHLSLSKVLQEALQEKMNV